MRKRVVWPLIDALSQASELVRRRTEAHPEDAVTMRLLALLAEHGELRPSGLAARLRVSRAAVTRRVRALESAREVSVVPDPSDGRGYRLALTRAGRRHLDAFADDLSARMANALAGWSEGDVEVLTALLERLVREAGEPPDGEPRRLRPWWRDA